ncbi:fimbrial protein [Luteimonas panaciterrae]|uniref:fimbrial protein n=1 Tax=Luteimonas panaciterrae TaxID=363885 RepID=UPI001CFA41B0|nr:fimbrial protein [Luteimonas panaciterrae]
MTSIFGLRRLLLAVTALYLFGWGAMAHAKSCIGPSAVGPATIPLQISGETNVPRDADVGSVVYTIKRSLSRLAGKGCEETLTAVRVGLGRHPSLAPGVYDTGIAGLGARFKMNGQVLYADGDMPTEVARVFSDQDMQLHIELIKMSPQVGAAMVEGSWLPRMTFSTPRSETVSMQLSGLIVLREDTCRTSDVHVDMGGVSASELRLRRTAAPTSFQIELRDCPKGVNRMRYRLNAIGPIQDVTASVVGMDTKATARYVGIQLRETDGKPVAFDTPRPLDGYDPRIGGSIRIPLQAVYVSDARHSPQPGTVSAAVAFTIIYE